MSKTVEIAYSPVSSVSSRTRDALPDPDTAAKACTLQRLLVVSSSLTAEEKRCRKNSWKGNLSQDTMFGNATHQEAAELGAYD